MLTCARLKLVTLIAPDRRLVEAMFKVCGMNDLPTDKANIRYADILRIFHVDAVGDDETLCMDGFQVKENGLYVILPNAKPWLTSEERAALSWHPTGHYEQPALPLPCTVGRLRKFVAEAGLEGCIDEKILADVLGAPDGLVKQAIADHAAMPGSAPEPQTTPVPTLSESGDRAPNKDQSLPASGGALFSVTKAALIDQHKHEWPTIQGDIADASKNGLAQAKAGKRGWWELSAMDWARANNKLIRPVEISALDNVMRNLPFREIRMKD